MILYDAPQKRIKNSMSSLTWWSFLEGHVRLGFMDGKAVTKFSNILQFLGKMLGF